MLFTNYTYSPKPAAQDVRLDCRIFKSQTETISVQYQINSQHRDGNPKKSRWTVSYEEEVSIFAGTVFDGIIEAKQYMWGLFIPEDEPAVLGETKYGDPTRIAIFDNGKHNGFWHGYPADYIRSQEYPPDEVFDYWRGKAIVSKATINKIIRGLW